MRSSRRSHDQWERWGSVDPYFAVITEPDYHQARIDSAGRKQFFATGRHQVKKLLDAIEQCTGASPARTRALDFGCGVGRLTLPLAERFEHVYGVDVSTSMLREAERNASEQHVSNVEWIETPRLSELSGRYDLVLSTIVFQHIPVREGERLFATLVAGLRPGGCGAIAVTLGPGHPVARVLRWARKSVPFAHNFINVLVLRLNWSHPYMELNAYSLDRLGVLLADSGITQWSVRFGRARKWRAMNIANIIFRKPDADRAADANSRVSSSGDRRDGAQ
ncbi:MAG TPA: class I SAM-dependent methyltransferase [Solirubrobacteraceae bacterium]|nr:class I SAM-dependent methyltransferase [Solirubrobacteraceae bacterium]